jgi:hypothetical protein
MITVWRLSMIGGSQMSDPVTIGTLAATALAMGAEAVVKTGVGEVVKDAYKALKDKVSKWASGEVATLEAAPTSKGKQLAVAEIVDAQLADDGERDGLRALVEVLIGKLKEDAPAIGLEFKRITDFEIELGKINVTGGVGVRVEDAKGGSFKAKDITVEAKPGKAQR